MVSAMKKDRSDCLWANIPHMSVTIGNLTFDAPVAVKYVGSKSSESAMLETDAHGYVYALPSGGRINSVGERLR